jgi:D-ribose pyranase
MGGRIGERYTQHVSEIEVHFESHADFKKRVPQVIGLIRTGDTIQYANMILESS